jgi:polar amino acid transport system permease protein
VKADRGRGEQPRPKLAPGQAPGPGRESLVARAAAATPWWLVALVGLGLFAAVTFASSAGYRVIVGAVAGGLAVTVTVSLIAYGFSALLGLALGLMRSSPFRPAREAATFYIELVRGLPMLVILYYIAFVGAPALASALNWALGPLIRAGLVEAVKSRSFDFATRAVIALTLGYGAFIAEIFRAGIESVDKGQVEAASALGMSRAQAMRRVILPQAIRNVLPALANEFVAIVKDSALVSVLGVQDITQLGKVYAASTFLFFETYNAVAFFYLVLTVTLSLLVRRLERSIKTGRRYHAQG